MAEYTRFESDVHVQVWSADMPAAVLRRNSVVSLAVGAALVFAADWTIYRVAGEIVGVSTIQYDGLFHRHFLDRKFNETFMAGQGSMKTSVIATCLHSAQVR